MHTAAHLERLGDHATNVAEEVIYIYSGQTVRHCTPPPSLDFCPTPRESREDKED
ncbi:MAG: hypothetical protein ACRCTY_09120 [Candidatus Adiutrix sp.]